MATALLDARFHRFDQLLVYRLDGEPRRPPYTATVAELEPCGERVRFRRDAYLSSSEVNFN
ncbi:MAG: hypothetical protein ABSH24_29775 [Bryobacteraceae bacterium]|jgi:hypothetical protein